MKCTRDVVLFRVRISKRRRSSADDILTLPTQTTNNNRNEHPTLSTYSRKSYELPRMPRSRSRKKINNHTTMINGQTSVDNHSEQQPNGSAIRYDSPVDLSNISTVTNSLAQLGLNPKITGSNSKIPIFVEHGPQPQHTPIHQRKPAKSLPTPCQIHGCLVPPDVQKRHLQHNQQVHSLLGRMSTPSSPLASTSSSPSMSRRQSLSERMTPSRSLVPSTTPSGKMSSLHECCVSYVPLCQLQQAMKKGEVLEGVLRINPKNFEDAYISAPGGGVDIYIRGVSDRNGAFNGDKVKVQLRPINEWKILYENLRTNWIDWENEFNNFQLESTGQAVSREPSQNDLNLVESNELITEKKEKRKRKKNKNKKRSEGNEIIAQDLEVTHDQVHYVNAVTVVKEVIPQENVQSECEVPSKIDENETELSVNNGFFRQLWDKLRIAKKEETIKSTSPTTSAFDQLVMIAEDTTASARPMTAKDTTSDVKETTPEEKARMKAEKKAAKKARKKEAEQKEAEQKEQASSTSTSPKPAIQSDARSDVEISPEEKARMRAERNARRYSARREAKVRKKERKQLKEQERLEKKSKKNELSNQIVKVPKQLPKQHEKKTQQESNATPRKSKSKKKKNPDDLLHGLPRKLWALSPEELLEYPFGSQCIQPTGRVVEIVDAVHPRIAGGKIQITDNPKFGLFIPTDKRVPHMLIPKDQFHYKLFMDFHLYKDALFMAKVVGWPPNSAKPLGEITDVLGRAGEIEAESKAILLENEVDEVPFPQIIEEGLQDIYKYWTIPNEEKAKRRNFTDQLVFTIDPLTARDLDDALSITEVGILDGKLVYEVGVHIADVSYFVPDNSLLDSEARKRSTSYYLVQRMIPMLPRMLCEKLCSLTSGEEKLTFSVVWKMTEDGQILDTWFGRTYIRSAVKLAYEHVQEMIDQGDDWVCPLGFPQIHMNYSPQDIYRSCRMLFALSQKMRNERFNSGSLKLDKVKFSFVLNESTGLPDGFTINMGISANHLVEEFMLAANQSVARLLLEKYPQHAFLRNHPSPDQKMLGELKNFCERIGVKMDITNAGSIHRCMMEAKTINADMHSVMSLMLLRAMKNANYFCAGMGYNSHHYALNIDYYTHFTSPIRRYPDVIVHRMLAAALGVGNMTPVSTESLQMMADHCNARKTASRMVSESSQKLFLCLFLRAMCPEEDGIVINVLDRAFDVLIAKYGIRVRLLMNEQFAGRKPVKFRSLSQNGMRSIEISWNNQIRQKISVTNIVRVQISVSEEDIMQIRATLIPPE